MKDTAVWAEACMAELFLNCDSWWGGEDHSLLSQG